MVGGQVVGGACCTRHASSVTGGRTTVALCTNFSSVPPASRFSPTPRPLPASYQPAVASHSSLPVVRPALPQPLQHHHFERRFRQPVLPRPLPPPVALGHGEWQPCRLLLLCRQPGMQQRGERQQRLQALAGQQRLAAACGCFAAVTTGVVAAGVRFVAARKEGIICTQLPSTSRKLTLVTAAHSCHARPPPPPPYPPAPAHPHTTPTHTTHTPPHRPAPAGAPAWAVAGPCVVGHRGWQVRRSGARALAACRRLPPACTPAACTPPPSLRARPPRARAGEAKTKTRLGCGSALPALQP